MERYAFSVMFVYCPQDGALEVVAKGGRDTQFAMQRAFCSSAFGIDVAPADPVRPVYDLSVLLDPSFNFPTDPRDHISRVSMTKVLLLTNGSNPEVDFLEIGFPKHATRDRVLERIWKTLEANEVSPTGVFVKDATIFLRFMDFWGSRPNEMPLNVTAPHGCDLKNKPEELQVIGERCLKMWEIRRA